MILKWLGLAWYWIKGAYCCTDHYSNHLVITIFTGLIREAGKYMCGWKLKPLKLNGIWVKVHLKVFLGIVTSQWPLLPVCRLVRWSVGPSIIISKKGGHFHSPFRALISFLDDVKDKVSQLFKNANNKYNYKLRGGKVIMRALLGHLLLAPYL